MYIREAKDVPHENTLYMVLGNQVWNVADIEAASPNFEELLIANAIRWRDRQEAELVDARRIIAASKRSPDACEERAGRRPIPRDVKMFVWQRDGGACVECDSQEDLEYDHIIPVSRGGSNTERNLQLLCEPCNRSKGAKIA